MPTGSRPRLLFTPSTIRIAEVAPTIGFIGLAVTLALFQILFSSPEGDELSSLLILTSVVNLVPGLVRKHSGAVGAIFAVTPSICVYLPPDGARPSFMVEGVFFVAAEWIARRWHVEAILPIGLVEAS